MSFGFDGTNDALTGAFASTYPGELLTIAAKVKFTDHPAAFKGLASLGNSNSTIDHSHYLRTSNVDDTWNIASTDTITNTAAYLLNLDNVWVSLVGKVASDSDRTIYVQSLANSANNTATRTINDLLKFIAIGENLAGGQDSNCLIAEVAMWRIALSDPNITDYMNGVGAELIAPADLIGFWSFRTNSLLNLGIDAGGDLTASGNAAFDADHPIILGGSVPIGQMLT